MKKQRSVITCTGGGGRTLPAKLGIEDVSSPCHAEQRERAEAQSENHAFRGAVFRELSKTVSGSVQHCVLPVTPARSRTKFGLTLVAPVLQLNPCDCTTRKVSVPAVKYPSLRADECRRGNPVKNAAPPCHSELVSESVPRYELVSNVGQTLNQVQGDKNMQCVCKSLPSLRAVGFTMAEILLSLTIIGVVAAITLPSLTGNINERTWNTQRKALYARFSQAIALMPALNGYGTLREFTDSAGSTSIEDTAAETFVTNGLSKVLKINNICDSEHLSDCGIPEKILTIDGTSTISFPAAIYDLNEKFNVSWTDAGGNSGSYSQINSKAAAFETANGESVAVFL